MKLNNKGFAITAVLYGLLILFVILVSSYLLVLSAKKDRVDNLVNEIEKDYSMETIKMPLQGAALYITNLYKNNIPVQITQYDTNNKEVAKYYYSYMDTKKTWGIMNDGINKSGNFITNADVLVNGTSGNIRYYGKNPDNYIYFNCSDYNNQTQYTCEKWRIIGVFDGKLKIIRDVSIGTYSWDYTSTGTFDNDWNNSALMKLLNDGYYYNKDNITYYNNSSTAIKIDFLSSNIGIKNATTQQLISESNWNLGGVSKTEQYPHEIYKNEIGELKCSTCTYSTTWMGKVALMYSSDYGYASDLSKCDQNLYYYDATNCYETNWLYNNSFQWLITPRNNVKTILDIYSNGRVHYGGNGTRDRLEVRPVLYLNYDVSFGYDGDGSLDNPYKILV